jgi:hypothetical protein
MAHYPTFGSGVICKPRTLPGAVIPAKAGICSARHWKCAGGGVDSRFRGNGQCFEVDSILNDTTTRPFLSLQTRVIIRYYPFKVWLGRCTCHHASGFHFLPAHLTATFGLASSLRANPHSKLACAENVQIGHKPWCGCLCYALRGAISLDGSTRSAWRVHNHRSDRPWQGRHPYSRACRGFLLVKGRGRQ